MPDSSRSSTRGKEARQAVPAPAPGSYYASGGKLYEVVLVEGDEVLMEDVVTFETQEFGRSDGLH